MLVNGTQLFHSGVTEKPAGSFCDHDAKRERLKSTEKILGPAVI